MADEVADVEERMKARTSSDMAPEVVAISAVHNALKGLELEIQARVLNYVATMLKIPGSSINLSGGEREDEASPLHVNEETAFQPPPAARGKGDQDDGELEGISPVARKWMRRNQLSAKQLGKLFSLGVDEIDLVAKKVPGENKTKRMRSVLLLKGVAAYLGSGIAKVTHEQVKEACLHYDAYDVNNFAKSLKGMASEIGGNREQGYTLTARGLTNATEMVRQLTEGEKA